MTNQPIKKIRAGLVEASIWENKHSKGNQEFTTRSVTLQRSYKDTNGEWQTTNSFNENDVPRAILCLEKTLEFLYLPPKDLEELPITEQEEVKNVDDDLQKKKDTLARSYAMGMISKEGYEQALKELKK